MSAVLHALNLHKYKQNISFSTEKDPSYAKKAIVQQQDIALTVYIPHEYFVHWYNLKQDNKLGECSFVELLNVFISRHGIEINKDCTRINGILRRYCGEVKSKVNGLRGRPKSTFLTKQKNISVFQSEIASVSEANKALETAQSVQQTLAQESKELNNQLDKLTGELKELQERNKRTEEELGCVTNDYETEVNENKELREYIAKIGIQDNCENTGKDIAQVGKRQQRRKLKEVKTHVERSLWFARTYGLNLESLKLFDNTGNDYVLEFNDKAPKKCYKELPETEQQKIKEVLFIQDKFCIGEAAYHELTMTSSGETLPRSYLVKQCKDSLNELCHIERTPGVNEGAQLDFNSALRNAIKKHVSKLNIILVLKCRISYSRLHNKRWTMHCYITTFYPF